MEKQFPHSHNAEQEDFVENQKASGFSGTTSLPPAEVDHDLEKINNFLSSESEKKLQQLERQVKDLSEIKAGLTTELYKKNKEEYLERLQSLEVKIAGMEALLVSYEAQIGIDHPKISNFHKVLLVMVAILKRSMSESSVIRILTTDSTKAGPHKQALSRFRDMVEEQRRDLRQLETEITNHELSNNPEFIKLSKKLIQVEGDLKIIKNSDNSMSALIDKVGRDYGWKSVDRHTLITQLNGEIQKIEDQLTLLRKQNK